MPRGRPIRTLSGGANPVIRGTEAAFARYMQDIFAWQWHEAKRRDVVNTMDFDWVASKESADEIYRLTHGKIGYFLTEGGKDAKAAIGVTLSDFIDRAPVQHAIREETYKFADAVGRSTQDKLRLSLSQGVGIGESIPELETRIKTVLGFDPEQEIYTPEGEAGSETLENWRAERIARTESARAIGIGHREYARETGVVKAMEWIASSDSCPFCLVMNGRLCGFDAPFIPKGGVIVAEWKGERIEMNVGYADILAPPAHVNCRCDTAPVLIDFYTGEE